MKILIYIVIALVCIALGYFFFLGQKSQGMTPSLGIQDGKLLTCGEKPNCVSSFNEPEDSHYIAPSVYKHETLAKLSELLKAQGFEIIKEEANYIYTTHKSSIFGYVDDIEFLLDSGQVFFRSASRVGYSDMDANRKRILRFKFQITQNL